MSSLHAHPLDDAVAATPAALRGAARTHVPTAATRPSGRGSATWRRTAGRALVRAATRLGDRIDARIVADHAPVIGDTTAWCTHHWGGLQEWPCPEYIEARAALDARRAG